MSREAKRWRIEKARIKRAAKARAQEIQEEASRPKFNVDRFKELVVETLKERTQDAHQGT